MKEKPASGQLIIVFTEHPVLGPLLVPYMAENTDEGILHITEQAFHTSPEAIARMSEAQRQAIDIASHYTEKYLMEVYSREKIVARFLHKLSEDPERLKNRVRPFIEKKLLEMLTLIRTCNLPLYQKQAGSKVLYGHHAYRVHPRDVEVRFTFELDDVSFAYELQCYYEGAPFSLSEQKPAVALTSSPATLLLNMDLYFFPHIESMRLLPFTKKRSIRVEVSQLEKYIDNIVIPIARYHDITTHGMEIPEENRPCESLLTIQDTVYEDQLLALSFRYGDRSFIPGTAAGMKRIVGRRASGDLFFFRRDASREEKALELLTGSGLQPVSDNLFKLAHLSPEMTITQWISNHREMLRHSFLLMGSTENTPYALDEICIEQSYDDGPDWFELHITVVIGQLRIPFSRFRKHILQEKREFLLPDGRMILLPEEWFSQYANVLEKGVQTEKGIRLKHAFVGAMQAAWSEGSIQNFPTGSSAPEVPVPQGLKATLRPYQQKGFRWMAHLNKQKFGGCLADDMGLGKTLQTLTLLQHLYKPGTAGKGEPEVTFAQSDKQPEVEADGQYALFSFAPESEFSPTNQSVAEKDRQQTGHAEEAQKEIVRRPATLIVVPTSLLHNWRREAKRFTTLSMAEYNSATVLSKDHPERFFGRFHLIFTTYGMMRNNIDLLRSYRFEYVVLDESQNIKNSDALTFQCAIQLQSNHRLTLTGTPIENSLKDLWAQFRFLQPDLLGDENDFQKQFILPIRQGNIRMEARLQQLIAPFILRRSKQEVAPELPPLTEETIYCDMTDEQRDRYKQEKNSLRNVLLRHPRTTEKTHLFNVLNGILRLRQLACHPQLLFSDFTGASGKTEQIIETFDTLRSEGHKVLIFSSFVKHLELLADAFRQREWKYALLTGSTGNRPSEIAHFTEQEDVQAFLISLKAGGVGLNLTQADYVFIIDPWWNPAAEMQAIARAHRIGQEKQVIAYRFITQDSIEEKILHLQKDKRKLAETFIADSEPLPALTNEQWVDLLE